MEVMKRLASIFLFFTLFFSIKQPIHAAIDQINNFDSEITINQDTSLNIKENIEYQTDLQKHGIYRYIPVLYNHDGQKLRRQIKNLKITADNGKKVPYEKSYSDQYLNLKIGDPDVTFTGSKNYQIEYQVENAVEKVDGIDQLLWDITGEGWKIPILKSRATVKSEFAQIDEIDCFTGMIDSNNFGCEFNKQPAANEANFEYDQSILYGHNFTVLLKLNPDNQLIFPTQADKIKSWLELNWSLLLLPLPILIMFGLWWFKGRDYEFISPNVFNNDPNQPQRLKPLRFTSRKPMVYEPLKDLTPGEAGALMDERVDNHDIVAEILELARKKYLKLELIEKKQLFGKSRDYEMTKLKEADDKLSEVQRYLHQKLFASKDVVTVKGLKGKFYTTMNATRDKINKSLTEKKLYTYNPTFAKVIGFIVIIFSVVMVSSLVISQVAQFGIMWPVPILVAEFILGAILAKNMPQKTALGNNLALQAQGLKASIKHGKWREEIKEKNLFIEEVLPFAVSLGVVNQLAKQMKDLNIKPPEYLHSHALSTWSTTQFVSGFSNEVASGLSYNPSSGSSSSGGSFSGGGGGGGGGGSW
jgi:uncharacterized membrane protein YgcG